MNKGAEERGSQPTLLRRRFTPMTKDMRRISWQQDETVIVSSLYIVYNTLARRLGVSYHSRLALAVAACVR